MQPASYDIWNKKYRLKDNNDIAIDKDMQDTNKRIAKALSEKEKEKETWEEQFLFALENGAIPAGRIISNAGASKYKPSTSLINCTVSDTIPDSMEGILESVKRGGLTLKAGCGVGYEFSTLRPSGAPVEGVGAYTSGPLSFMDIFDKMCFTISSAGGRRGAQMATFDISHPDAVAFIKAKREDGRLRQFNMSLLITKDFVEAVKNDDEWNFIFPVHKQEYSENDAYVWKYPNYDISENEAQFNEQGQVAHKIYNTMNAKEVWEIIMKSTYDYAEPGFILIDKVNEMNNNWFCENIRSSNPCGEQPLPPDGSCLLGSINLTKFITNPFSSNARFEWKKFNEIVKIFSRMLDNVVEMNGLPLKEQRNEIKRKRRHGMGFMGLGSALNMMGVDYGSDSSARFTERVSKAIALSGFEAGVELAEEKGAAPIMDEHFEMTHKLLEEYESRGGNTVDLNVGDKLLGRELWAFSNYMLKIRKVDEELWTKLRNKGCRYTHHSSIAPTGTIALSIGNNCSNGIEPSFSHHYTRNIIEEGKNTKVNVDVWSFEALFYRETFGEGVDLPETWCDADTITPADHVKVQAAAQKWVDSSISKTVNIPTDFDFDKFKDVYMDAYDSGLKGCTTFRFNPEVFQGVLVKHDDLANTNYTFTMEDGSEETFTGDEIITYEGEETTAANLYDAIKEGYYGKL